MHMPGKGRPQIAQIWGESTKIVVEIFIANPPNLYHMTKNA